MLIQYCDGGDLKQYQNKQPEKVFSLKRATEILTDVIIALEIMH